MDRDHLLQLLEAVRDRAMSPEAAAAAVRRERAENPGHAEDLGYAVVDHGRAQRCGFPEVVFSEGKTAEQVGEVAGRIWARHDRLLCTRADADAFAAVRRHVPEAAYDARARVVWARRGAAGDGEGLVAVVTAGTADIPVAEEARITAMLMGARVETHYDVGVAGLHRLLDRLARLRRARALVVAAGMEGALPSVVGGLVDRPVVAVPTAVGYGAGFGGLSALLGMLNTCAANVTVVNIQNGFGAGYVAALINRTADLEASAESVPAAREPSGA